MRYSLILRQIKWRLRIKSPIVSNIKITNMCNLRCKMCNPSIRTEGSKELTTEEWKNTLRILKKKGVRIVVFEGGEPTLRPDLQQLIDFCKSNGMKTIVITNGVNDFSSIYPDCIWISIDGIQQHHEEIRGKNIYEKILKNIEKNKSKNLLILSMINTLNLDDIELFASEFSEFPIYFNWMYGYDDIQVKPMTSDQKISASHRIIALKKNGKNIFNSYNSLENVGRRKTCNYWLLETVDSGGKIDNSCMVKRFNQNCNCTDCDLACYIELNNIFNLDYETRKNWKKLTGFDLTFKLEDLFFR